MKKKRYCAIILNRNLPKVTNRLYKNLKDNNSNLDVYVLESGSDKNKISRHCTWYANWKSALKNGLRYSRGMNFALSKLDAENKIDNYEAFILLSNDTEFNNYSITGKIQSILKKHDKIGILSPCSKNWGEYQLLKKNKTKYFWFIHNSAYIITKKFLNAVKNKSKKPYMDYFFDGSNFRGYGSEFDIILKAYSNDFSAAITSKIIAEENTSYLLNSSKIIKTDNYEENLNRYIKEGETWLKKKYGFSDKWSINMTVKLFYDKFFEYYPQLKNYKI